MGDLPNDLPQYSKKKGVIFRLTNGSGMSIFFPKSLVKQWEQFPPQLDSMFFCYFFSDFVVPSLNILKPKHKNYKFIYHISTYSFLNFPHFFFSFLSPGCLLLTSHPSPFLFFPRAFHRPNRGAGDPTAAQEAPQHRKGPWLVRRNLSWPMGWVWSYCWWVPEIRRSPVEVGSWSPYLQGFSTIPGGAGFLPSRVETGGKFSGKGSFMKKKSRFRASPQKNPPFFFPGLKRMEILKKNLAWRGFFWGAILGASKIQQTCWEMLVFNSLKEQYGLWSLRHTQIYSQFNSIYLWYINHLSTIILYIFYLHFPTFFLLGIFVVLTFSLWVGEFDWLAVINKSKRKCYIINMY